MAKEKKEQIIVRVDVIMKYELTKLAEQSRRSLSDYLRRILEDTIKNKTTL